MALSLGLGILAIVFALIGISTRLVEIRDELNGIRKYIETE